MITIPDFLTFLANNTIIAWLALVAWIFVVAVVVWLGEKANRKIPPAPQQNSDASRCLSKFSDGRRAGECWRAGQRRAQARSGTGGSRMTTTPCPICEADADVLPIPDFTPQSRVAWNPLPFAVGRRRRAPARGPILAPRACVAYRSG
jgi:hypothetical protein